MKTITKTAIAVLMIFNIISCKKENVKFSSTMIDVVADSTDLHALLPETDPILALYDFKNEPGKEATFRFSVITDRHLNPTAEFRISDGATTESENKKNINHYRENLIVGFYAKIRKRIADFDSARTNAKPIDHSECFFAISTEVNLLAKSKSTERYLIVFSDLQENSYAFNCYSPSGKALFRSQPEQVAELLNSSCPLPNDLTDITVYFVFKPKTRDEDEKYLLMNGIYKRLLESRHAKVITQAQNESFEK